ncbi:hypothetical protein [uncultured Alsobacter sp.]|uniref:hypothetical protein n=1 Tax=uncultured Alsobacter sp. TaxID=1748258 RepID=UPI0025D49EDD|nr:hypothetical protein [uncultured Alsobacter sp.]
MKTLSLHDLDALLAIILRVKGAHVVTLQAINLGAEERARLLDEISVIDRLAPKLVNARLEAKEPSRR